MKILLVAATKSEIDSTLNKLNLSAEINIDSSDISVLIPGVGMVATAFALGRILEVQKFDLAINAGIAGSFDRSLQIGETVSVKLDCFAELGAEDGEDFISIDALGFGQSNVKPQHLFDHVSTSLLKKVNAITVNKVQGNDESIYNMVSRLNPQIESMEGAAFFYACNQKQVPCLQLRSISNYVERRNKENWNIPLAVHNLNTTLIDLINRIL